MNVVVAGGAGYIGSHMVHLLRERGHEVGVIDSLISGHREALPAGVPLLEADVGDRRAVTAFLRERKAEAVLHFAARIQVGESVVDPRLYYNGNLVATVGLLDAVLDAGVERVIFSSTAAVYGVPTEVPIPEGHATAPVNPYGETKLATEHMLASYARAYGLRYAALRYFNAAGAAAGLGERHEPETHLIPLVLRAALGAGKPVTVFGRDYPTPDGTCVRDYVHVLDLAEAHLAALEYLGRGGESGAFNLGTGRGYSVAEVIAEAARVCRRDVPCHEGPRRPGDPPSLVADPSWPTPRSLAPVSAGKRATRRSRRSSKTPGASTPTGPERLGAWQASGA
ncbi:MAG: UDP-glucose 4-epimerase GalE [Polyangiaceae bacterium]|nr:UDP-glucose 4-epimerase GalE [Polyangiaceae bacterium]